jgi:hypothetical protein
MQHLKLLKLLFVPINLLEDIVIQLQFPINITCDNLGAMYNCYSQRTRNIDTRHNFALVWVEDDILKIILTPTQINADIKNSSELNNPDTLC